MRKKIWSLAIAILCVLHSGDIVAEIYTYSGEVTLCTGTCDGFASLDVGSTLNDTFEINTTANGNFGDADFGPFQVEIFNPAMPVRGPVGDPITDNPLLFDSALGIAASNGTSGTTDAANQINGGLMLIELLIPPFSSNGTFIVYDLATGNGQICVFYTTAGCIPGATEVVKFEGSFTTDSDGDGIDYQADNCPDDFNPFQEDFDGDGAGYVCDSTCASIMNFSYTFINGEIFELLASDAIHFDGVMESGSEIRFSAPSVTLHPNTSIEVGTAFVIDELGCATE